eukprot:Skav224116  [mRNA]  locus=scaffold2427:200347:201221:+ [translate_table: standard]
MSFTMSNRLKRPASALESTPAIQEMAVVPATLSTGEGESAQSAWPDGLNDDDWCRQQRRAEALMITKNSSDDFVRQSVNNSDEYELEVMLLDRIVLVCCGIVLVCVGLLLAVGCLIAIASPDSLRQQSTISLVADKLHTDFEDVRKTILLQLGLFNLSLCCQFV